MQGIIQKGRDLRNATIEELRITLMELLYELRYRFSTISKENFGQQDLVELSDVLFGILAERERVERKPLTVTVDHGGAPVLSVGIEASATLDEILEAKKAGRQVRLVNANGAEGLFMRADEDGAVFHVIDYDDYPAERYLLQYTIRNDGASVSGGWI